MEDKIIDRKADGTYIDSKIFIDRHMLDKGTMNQIRELIHHPSVEKSRFMPDCHRGKGGCCVGYTSVLIEKIVPRFIGNDIGCGILTYPLPFQITDLPTMEKIIRDNIPMGTFVTEDNKPIWDIPIVSDPDIEWACNEANYDALQFIHKYKEKFGVNIAQYCPTYSKEWFMELCKKCDADYDYIIRTIGTVGGGNHFVELNRSIKDNVDYITVHSGSRSIGDHVYMYHQRKINDTYQFDYEDYKHKIKLFERKSKVSKEIKAYKDSLKDEFIKAKHTDYLEGPEAYEYYFDMLFSQKVAQLNRRMILKRILHTMKISCYDEDQIIESIHNYIDFNDFIIRKGAIQAHTGQKVIISLNMRDGILICEGKGNDDWNYSSAHGSGRIIARNEVSAKFSMQEFKDSMAGVYSTSVVPEVLDECPMAYRDTEIIKNALQNTIVIIEQLKPIINVKGIN